MELTKLSNQELLSRLDRLVQSERKITHVILCHINEVETRRLYAELGFGSMFKYLTQLTQVQKCLKQENKTGVSLNSKQTLQLLEQIENKSSFETKKVLAIEFNQPLQSHEVVKPQRDESVRLELTFTSDQMKTLSQVKDLLSHTLPEGNWAELIVHLAEKHLQKTLGKNHLKQKETTPCFTVARKRRPIKITLRRKLLQKAHHCCEFFDTKTNTKCQSSYQLQIDHRIPLARGGSDSEANLRVLCRTHNLLAAKHWGLD